MEIHRIDDTIYRETLRLEFDAQILFLIGLAGHFAAFNFDRLVLLLIKMADLDLFILLQRILCLDQDPDTALWMQFIAFTIFQSDVKEAGSCHLRGFKINEFFLHLSFIRFILFLFGDLFYLKRYIRREACFLCIGNSNCVILPFGPEFSRNGLFNLCFLCFGAFSVLCVIIGRQLFRVEADRAVQILFIIPLQDISGF